MKRPCRHCHQLIEASQYEKHLNGHRNARPGKRDLSWANKEWQRLRRQVLQRDGYRCRVCGRSRAELKRVGLHLEVHHLIEASAGGPDTMANCEARCSDHNPRGGWRPRDDGV